MLKARHFLRTLVWLVNSDIHHMDTCVAVIMGIRDRDDALNSEYLQEFKQLYTFPRTDCPYRNCKKNILLNKQLFIS